MASDIEICYYDRNSSRTCRKNRQTNYGMEIAQHAGEFDGLVKQFTADANVM